MANTDDMHALGFWLSTKRGQWEALERRLNKRGTSAGREVDDARAVLTGYRALLADVSLARQVYRDGPVTRYLENLFLQVNEELYRSSGHLWARIAGLYNSETPRLLRRLAGALLAAVLLFILDAPQFRGQPELLRLGASYADQPSLGRIGDFRRVRSMIGPSAPPGRRPPEPCRYISKSSAGSSPIFAESR